jgi:hypothetical protein
MLCSLKHMQSDEKSNQQQHSVKKNEMITVIGALCFNMYNMSNVNMYITCITCSWFVI